MQLSEFDENVLREFVRRNPRLFHGGLIAPLSLEKEKSPDEKLDMLVDKVNDLSMQIDQLISMQRWEMLETRSRLQTKIEHDYSNGFYMSAGLSAFGGLLGFLYFGGYLGALSLLAAAGPFLISVWGLARSRRR
jgi:hypothetical protein